MTELKKRKSRYFTRHPVDKEEFENELNVLIHSIYSTDYLKKVHPFIKKAFFWADHMQKVWSMIDEHFQQYEIALGEEDFQQKYLKDIKPKFQEVDAKLVESFLTYLSDHAKDMKAEEFREERIPYLADRALTWAQKRHKELWDFKTEDLKDQGKIWEALVHASQYSTLATGGEIDLLSKTQSVIIDSSDFINAEIPPLRQILYPWLIEGSLTMIFSKAGIGKTWLGLIIGIITTRTKAVGTEIGPWSVMNQAGVLYIDGEMSQQDLQDRMKGLTKHCGEEDREHPLALLSADIYAKEYKSRINIANEEWRDVIYEILAQNDQYEILVLDNISSLIPGGDENLKKEWDPINQWFLSLRHLGKSVIFEHHAGKGGGQRGTSGREDNINNTIVLTLPDDYKEGEGARFNVGFEKKRGYDPEGGFSNFELKVVNHDDGSSSWETSSVHESGGQEIVMALLMDNGLTQKEIAQMVGVSASAVNQTKNKAVKLGYMDNDRNSTKNGKELLERIDVDEYLGKGEN